MTRMNRKILSQRQHVVVIRAKVTEVLIGIGLVMMGIVRARARQTVHLLGQKSLQIQAQIQIQIHLQMQMQMQKKVVVET